MYQLIHKPTFTRHFVDLSKELQKRIVKDLEILEQSPNNVASKNIEHLGKKRELWSYRVNDNFRILYVIQEPFVQLLDVGTHDYIYGLVDRLQKRQHTRPRRAGRGARPDQPHHCCGYSRLATRSPRTSRRHGRGAAHGQALAHGNHRRGAATPADSGGLSPGVGRLSDRG